VEAVVRKNDDGTVTAMAANGHLMRYDVRENGDPIQHSARCEDGCRACADGDQRPDW
jgi:hypothetical protein